VTRLKFVSKDTSGGEAFAGQTSSEKMRALDELHRHAPLEEECLMLNIPDDRLDLHKLSDVLSLCGGYVAMRFSSQELTDLGELVQALTRSWSLVETEFGQLSNEEKRKKGGWTSAVCDEYLHSMRVLQTMIAVKQALLESSSEKGEGRIDRKQSGGADPDGSRGVGALHPSWLALLLDKYKQHTATAGQQRALVTVGKFAAFLSCLVLKQVPVSEEEKNAVLFLLQASNDCHVHFHIDSGLVDLELNGEEAEGEEKRRPQSYWARRFFAFLCALSELKSLPKDEKSVETFESFLA